MQHEEDNDPQAYQLPPVQLPQIPMVHKKTVEQLLVTLTDNFKQDILKIDDGSIQCLQYLTDNTLLAVGCSSGVVKIVSPTQKNVQFLLKSQDTSPVVALAHNPNSTPIRHAVMVAHSQGTLQYWHATSRQILFSKKYATMIQACEINPQGTYYAFGGQQGKILFGHLNKGDPEQVENGHLGMHQNRIFCLKWHTSNTNLVLSGGWDRSVHFWDIRSKTSVKQLFGYYIGGQAIDIRGDQILLGNNKPQNQLRIYDQKADKVRNIDWPYSNIQQSFYTTGVLSCAFFQSGNIIACTPKNQVRLYKQGKCISQYTRYNQTSSSPQPQQQQQQKLRLFCMAKDSNNRVVTGWNDGSLRWLTY